MRTLLIIALCLVANMPVDRGKGNWAPMGGIDGCWQTLTVGDGVTIECQYKGGELLC